jgi:hydrogenase/urease accessory protein HupE
MRPLLRIAAFFLAVLASLPALAHEVGLSRVDVRQAEGEALAVEIGFARRDLAAVDPGLDADGDGELEASEIDPAAARLTGTILGKIVVARGGAPCEGVVRSASLDEEDGAVVRTEYAACSGAGVSIDLAALFGALPAGHRTAVFIHRAAGDPEESLLRGGSPRLETAAFGTSSELAPATKSSGGVAWEYFVLGIEHIVFGIDHVVFLLGLILVGGRFRQLAIMVTAFTASHSVTLALAVLGVIAPSPRVIEPVIALSVAYVGVENFVAKDAANRWRVAGLFGLVHGFGFAGALGEVGMPSGGVPLALATFNLGVEAGQLALLAAALPLVLWLRKKDWFMPRGVQVASAMVVLAGLFWFVTRVVPGA